MLLTIFEPLAPNSNRHLPRRVVRAALFAAAAGLQVARCCFYSGLVGSGSVMDSGLPAAAQRGANFEWSNALAMMAFALNDVYGRPGTAKCAAAIVLAPSDDECVCLAVVVVVVVVVLGGCGSELTAALL